MLRNKRLPILLLSLLALLLGVSVQASDLIPLSEIGDESANYRTTVVERTDAISERTCSATIYLPVEHKIYYKGADAYFVKDLAVYGNDVKEGASVFEIDPDVDEIRLTELQLQKEELERQYNDANAVRDKEIVKLVKQHTEAMPGDPYTAELLDYRVKILNLEAEKATYEYNNKIESLDKEIAELEEELKRTTIDSPFSGRLSYMLGMTAGRIIRDGEHVMSVTDLTKIYLRANASIPLGLPVKVSVGYRGDDYVFDGKCVINCSMMTAGTDTTSIIEINMEDLLSINDNLRQLDVRAVRIEVTFTDSCMKNVLVVSTDALQKDGNYYYAEILDDENVIHRRPVKVMVLKNQIAWVIDGLEEGDVLVLQ